MIGLLTQMGNLDTGKHREREYHMKPEAETRSQGCCLQQQQSPPPAQEQSSWEKSAPISHTLHCALRVDGPQAEHRPANGSPGRGGWTVGTFVLAVDKQVFCQLSSLSKATLCLSGWNYSASHQQPHPKSCFLKSPSLLPGFLASSC